MKQEISEDWRNLVDGINAAAGTNLPYEVGAGETKRHQLVFALAEQPLKGEDYVLSRSELGLFGVFDGMGGHTGGAEASRLAADTVAESVSQIATISSPITEDELSYQQQGLIRSALVAANQALAVQNHGKSGFETMGTTATIVRVLQLSSGECRAFWGHVGDSRLYLRYADGRLDQITRDEGEAHVLLNAINGQAHITQVGALILQTGDRLLLCSDGITGDKGDQLLSDQELLEALDPQQSAAQAAHRLVDISRKRDDKSALVIDI